MCVGISIRVYYFLDVLIRSDKNAINRKAIMSKTNDNMSEAMFDCKEQKIN